VILDLRQPENRALLTAIRRLVSEYSEDDVQRAIAEVVSEPTREEWAKRRKLTRSRGAVCAMRLLGRKCRDDGRRECACRPPGTDHPTLWNFRNKPAVYVSQPYYLEWKDVSGLASYCETWKLSIVIDTYPAWHFPGRILFVAVAPTDGVYWKLPEEIEVKPGGVV
jgi:hypothetical protein